MIKMKMIRYICRKVHKIIGKIHFCFNGNYSIGTLNKTEGPQAGASHSYLDKIYALMCDNQPFICWYCNFTALKLSL